MAYGDLADLRKLAGGISSTTLSDGELSDFLNYGDDRYEISGFRLLHYSRFYQTSVHSH